MKTIKLNFLLVIMALGVFTFSSCEDEFTEEDFLQMQADLAAEQQAFDLEKLILEYSLIRDNDSASMVFAQQLAAYTAELQDAQEEENLEALRQAGLLASYTVTVENQGGVPIDSAIVSVGGNNSGARVSLATDATGQVVINDLVIGASPVQITAAGYVGVQYIVDFGNTNSGEEFQVLGDRIYPLGRNETNGFVLVSLNGGAGTFATVNGTATIETDLTNEASEIPQDITITAYLDYYGANVFYFDDPSCGCELVSAFRFIAEGIGSAVVDNTTGAWSMLLPATEDGIEYILQAPTLQLDQTIVIDTRDDQPLTPELATVPARYGEDVGWSPAISISGAMAVFPSPTGAGNGANLTFTAIARNVNFTLDIDGNAGSDNQDNIQFEIESEGGTFQTSPTATLTATGTPTTAATLSTSLIGDLDLAVSGGVGYTIGEDYDITVNVLSGATVLDNVTFTVTAVDDGAGNGVLPDPLVDETNLALNNFLEDGSNLLNEFGITSYSVVVTEVAPAVAPTTAATITVTCDCVVDQVQATGGVGYPGNITGLSFSGGGGTAFPIVDVRATGFEYTVAIDNAGITVPYTIEPGVGWFVTTAGGFPNASTTTTDAVSFTEAGNGQAGNLTDLLARDGSGNLILNRTVTNLRTNISYAAPIPQIVEPTATPVMARLIINSDGTIAGLANTGTTGTTTNNPLNGASNGAGFTSIFGATVSPTLATSPGTGGAIQLSDFNDPGTGEIIWNGAWTVTDRGSDYLPELNRSTFGAFNIVGGATVVARSGEVLERTIEYNSGLRLQNVDQ